MLCRTDGRRSSTSTRLPALARQIVPLIVLLVFSVLLCGALGQESASRVREVRRVMMTSNTNSSPPPTSAAKALGANKNVPSPSSSSASSAVPGLPDLPSTDATLESIREDAAAAIRALRIAVDYNGRKKLPSKEPVWRPGVSSFVATPAFVATTAAEAVTARAEGAAAAAAGGAPSTAIPEGIVVEEYEVLSEERERWVDGVRVRERLWVPVTVARSTNSSGGGGGSGGGGSGGGDKASSSSSSSSSPPSSSPSHPALFLLHSTAGSRAKTRARLLRAAERGYVALAPEFRYFGTRGQLWELVPSPPPPPLSSSPKDPALRAAAAAAVADFALYQSELVRSYQGKGSEERPFLLDNCWDLQRVLDWLLFVGAGDDHGGGGDGDGSGGGGGGGDAVVDDGEEGVEEEKEGDAPNRKQRRQRLFNVDASRVGTTGISLGGMISVLFGVLEQDRIAAVAPAIGVPTFAWGAAHGSEWTPRAASIPSVFDFAAEEAGLAEPTAETYVRVLNAIAPGLLGPFDASRSLAALAPRPLLIANGAGDGRNPLGGVEQAVARARKVYESENKASHLEYFLDPSAGHEYTPALEAKVDAWLDRWLLLRK